MSLYLKYRPQNFTELVSNQSTVDAITNMLSKPNPPHTYLLQGPTGCGKTTIARIMATMLGCVGNDYREVDSADFRGIDTIREIRKQAQFKPLEGKCRVWVIDEVHKSTNDAQNALLKILEDTPEHVFFILCTTEPDKLIKTVRGRCSIFTVNQLSDKEMFRLLRRITTQEGETLEKEIYDQIIQDSLGHPRNAIQTLEQVLNVEPELRMNVAQKKAEEYNEAIELCRALINGSSWKKVATILAGIKANNQEHETVRRVVLGYCQAILLKGAENDKAGRIMEEMIEPFYNSGFPQLTYACYSICRF